jgi:hypothetical protein
VRQNGDRLEIYFHRWKNARRAIIPLIFVALGIFILVASALSASDDPRRNFGLGFITTFFFGLCAALPLSRLLRRTPMLILDSKGLTVRTTKKEWFIPWEDVGAVYTMNVVVHSMVMVQPLDQEKYRKLQPAWSQKISGSQPYSRPIGDTEYKTNELAEMIKGFWLKYRSPESPDAPPVLAEYQR